MSIETFYTTASQLCFTLLGFWWAVVQFRHGEWMNRPSYRRMAHAVSLHFMLPGIMSLVSLLAGDAKYLWRATFGVAGLLGMVATLLIITTVKQEAGSIPLARIAQWVAVPLYGLIVVVALRPELIQDFGFTLEPLQLEGILLSLLVFLGVNFAWLLFAEPVKEV